MRKKRHFQPFSRTPGIAIGLLSILGISSMAATIFLLAGIEDFYFQVISYGVAMAGNIITLGGSLLFMAGSKYGKAAVRIGSIIIVIAGGMGFSYSIIGGLATLLFGILLFILSGYARV